jgi:hypothetical protein
MMVTFEGKTMEIVTEAHKEVVDMVCSLKKADFYLSATSVFEHNLGRLTHTFRS